MKLEDAQKHFEYRDGKLYNKVTRNHKARKGAEVGSFDAMGYRQFQFRGESCRTHRIVWLLHHGVMPTLIDHINRDKADNRIENLRDVDHATNNRNRATLGVHVHTQTKRWVAQLHVDDKTKYIGCFDTKEEALVARKAAEIKHWGDKR